MAQLLIFQRNNVNTSDDRGSYKIGDVIMVADDAHVFGSAELQYPFTIVNVVKADYEYLLESEPATLRDSYPRSMLAIKRLHIPMMRALRVDDRARRKYSVDSAKNVIRKQPGAV